MSPITLTGQIYEKFLCGKYYDDATKNCILDAVSKLTSIHSSDEHPGMLLGKIQSGKTRTYLGIIALSLDNGYDLAIVFTKGTNALTNQTVMRLKDEYSNLIQDDLVDVFDIMAIRTNGLSKYQLKKKLIIVCKKEDDNLRHLHNIIFNKHDELGARRTLVVDDEADFASISFVKEKDNGVKAGAIAKSINVLRNSLPKSSSFLQVTATPYSLYLQPNDEIEIQSKIFKPIRPAFTVLVPIHDKYIGGDFYFNDSADDNNVAFFLHEKIEPEEMLRLKKEDNRRCRKEDILTDHKLKGLRSAVVNFVVAACIRRIQQASKKERQKKFSFIVHTDSSKNAHKWQEQLLTTLVEKFKEALISGDPHITDLIKDAYNNLVLSIRIYQKEDNTYRLPAFSEIYKEVKDTCEYLDVTVVNSDNDVQNQLDPATGQLKLNSPYNIFVGGAILDRGLTIENMIGFFYGREPKRFQQDTVLQHSRMYGARPKEDLPVTRFYTTEYIYQVMKNIHEFDSNLREQIQNQNNETGVVFIQRDRDNHIIPCSPNKILLSETTNLKPHKRLLPVGFQTGYQSNIAKDIKKIDKMILAKASLDPFLISLNDADVILSLIKKTLMFSNNDYENLGQVPNSELFKDLGLTWDIEAHKAAMAYASKECSAKERHNKVWCLVRPNRNTSRVRNYGNRFSDVPDTQPERKILEVWAKDIPMLMLFRQNGEKNKGWMGTPFWWPVLYMPKNCKISVYANRTQRQ